MKPARRPRRGHSLLELVVVLAILGVLAAAILPLAETAAAARKDRELREALWEIRSALDEYKRTADALRLPGRGSGYPPSLQALLDGLPDPRDPTGHRRLVFLRRIPRDPHADPALPPQQTWRVRSYASTSDDPRPGDDVYDVRSLSTGTGIDGTPHASW